MSLRTNLDTKTEVTLYNGNAAIAFPANANAGASINVDPQSKARDAANPGAWRFDGAAHVDAVLFIDSDAAVAFNAALGLYGYRADIDNWFLIGKLNDGNPISTLGAKTGFAQTLQFAGVFDRLAVGPIAAANVNVAGGNATITVAQIKTKELV